MNRNKSIVPDRSMPSAAVYVRQGEILVPLQNSNVLPKLAPLTYQGHYCYLPENAAIQPDQLIFSVTCIHDETRPSHVKRRLAQWQANSANQALRQQRCAIGNTFHALLQRQR